LRTNFHIDFIAAVANLRARNYKITEVPRLKVKLIAGKIIPAIATTTAMVIGAVGLEIIKLIQQRDLSFYRNTFMNLALPLWLFSDPLPPTEAKDKDYDEILMGPVKAIPPKWTTWHRLEVKGPMTLVQMIEHFKKTWGVNVSMMTAGKIILYNQYSKEMCTPERTEKTPEAVIEMILKKPWPKYKKYVEMEVSGDLEGGIDCLLPSVKYLSK